jgi:hypothetical protein
MEHIHANLGEYRVQFGDDFLVVSQVDSFGDVTRMVIEEDTLEKIVSLVKLNKKKNENAKPSYH